MDGIHRPGLAKIKTGRPAMVDRMYFFDPLFPQPSSYFRCSHDNRSRLLRNVNYIARVVAMPMRNKNIIRLELVNIHVFYSRVTGKKRVKQQSLAVYFYRKCRMTVKS